MKKSLISCLALGAFFTACNSDNATNATVASTTDSVQTTETKPVDNKPIAQENAFEEVSPDAFNKKLSEQKQKLSPEAVIKLYYPAVIPKDDDSFQKIAIETKTEGDKTIVTIVHDNQPHIVIQGHRIVMTMTKEKGQWKVLSIAQQFKCWVRKAGVVWGVDKCS